MRHNVFSFLVRERQRMCRFPNRSGSTANWLFGHETFPCQKNLLNCNRTVQIEISTKEEIDLELSCGQCAHFVELFSANQLVESCLSSPLTSGTHCEGESGFGKRKDTPTVNSWFGKRGRSKSPGLAADFLKQCPSLLTLNDVLPDRTLFGTKQQNSWQVYPSARVQKGVS